MVQLSQENRRDLVRNAEAGIVSCIAHSNKGGQTYRLVFTFSGGESVTLQSDIQGGEEEIGFLVLDPKIYEPDDQSSKSTLLAGTTVSNVQFYVVDGCDEPSRIKFALDTGSTLSISSDAFPHGIAYEFGEVRVGLAQYDDAEYHLAS